MPTTDKPPLPPGWRYLEQEEATRPDDLYVNDYGQYVIVGDGVLSGKLVGITFYGRHVIRRIEPDAEVERLKKQLHAVDDLLKWQGTGMGRVGAIDWLMEFAGIAHEDIHERLCQAWREQSGLEGGLEQPDADDVEQMKTDNAWILCSKRMPTAEDGDVNGRVAFACPEKDKYAVLRVASPEVIRTWKWTHWRPTGIDSLPEPPAEPEPPKRHRFWICGSKWFSTKTEAEAYSQPEGIAVVECVNVLPGDPDIDACRKLLDWLELAAPENPTMNLIMLSRTDLRDLIAKCRGKCDA